MRGNKEKHFRTPKPVKNIEVSEGNIKFRIILLIAAVVLALCAFGYGIWSCVSVDDGWASIGYNGSELNVSQEFIFMYELGSGELSATVEYRELTNLYSEMTEKAYKLFNTDETFSDVNSIAYVNSKVNESVELDPALYSALKKFTEQGGRYIYIAAVYGEYEATFFGNNGTVVGEQYDPRVNPDTAKLFAELAKYANSPEHIVLEFLGDNTVRLKVSEEYLAYAKANEITEFVNFMWLKNAFVIDYFAETLISKGYTNGTLTSYDGFTRNLDKRGALTYDYNLFDLNGDTVYVGGKLRYSTPIAIVYYKSYMMDELDVWHYYTRSDGSTVTPYVSVTDGLYKAASENLVAYSSELGCVDVALKTLSAYVSDTLDTELLNESANVGIYSVWCKDGVFWYNEKDAKLTGLFDEGTVKYTAEYAGK